MKIFYKFCLPLFFVLICGHVSGQTFYQNDTTVKVFAYSKQLPLAWSGGFNNPQFSNADLNHDGLQDLVVFEPGLGVSTFINTGTVGGMPNYRVDPKYALNFPPINHYMQLADYNCDGIADLFERGGDGFAVHKGYYNAGDELSFTFYRNLIYYNSVSSGGPVNAYVIPTDIPAIVDVDNDGDLDFVAYYISGGNMYYHRNMRVEDGLPCDSIRIKLVDRCWGKVYQGFDRAHTLGYSCSNAGLLRTGQKRTHSANSICLFDWDMDGDMDYLNGNLSFNEMTFLKNGKLETSCPVDTMIFQDTMWQTGGKRVELPSWPAAYNFDADLDGKKDLLIAPNGAGGENYNCIWYYRNNSTTGTPDWQFQSDSFLVDKSIDLGTASYPMLFDYDKDGKLDLIVGSDGYRQPSGLLKSRLSLYTNTSTPGNASFTLSTTDFINISAQNFQGAAPAAGDIDNDGNSDLILGHTNGTLSYYKNAAIEAVAPDWQLNQVDLKDLSGNVINVGGYAAPFIYDIDKDGKKDLIIGTAYGYIQYYRNESTTPGAIRLRLINARLGKAKSDPLQNVGNFATPFIGKIDPSGTDFLLMGSNSGNVYQYTGFQSGDTTALYSLLDAQYSYIDTMYNSYNHLPPIGVYSDHRSALTVGDIDGSGSYAMIKGNVRGGLEFYKRKVYVANTPDVKDNMKLLVYPNPAKDLLHLAWADGDTGKEVEVAIYTLDGKRCFSSSFPSLSGHTIVPIGNLPNGLYMCILQSNGSRYYSKFSIIR